MPCGWHAGPGAVHAWPPRSALDPECALAAHV